MPPCLRLSRIWAMRTDFHTKISLYPMPLTSWTQSLKQNWEPEPKMTTQRLILSESTVQEISHENRPNQGPLCQNGGGDPQRRQQGTVPVNYSCNPNRDKLMFHLSPRPVAQANLGSTGMHRGYSTAAESFLSFPLPSHIQPPSPQDMTLP